MQRIDQFPGFTAERVENALRGKTGRRELTFRYEHLDETNAVVSELDTVLAGGTITHQAETDIKRTAKLTLTDQGDINFLTDRIRVYARLHIPAAQVPGQFPISQNYDDAFNRFSSSLLARWRLEDVAGALVDDVAGNNLTASGISYSQPGLVSDGGRSVRVDGAGRLDAGSADFLNGLTAFSVGGWVKADTPGADASLVSTTFTVSWGDYLDQTWDDLLALSWGQVLSGDTQGAYNIIGNTPYNVLGATPYNEMVSQDTDSFSVRTDSALGNLVATLTVGGKTISAQTEPNTATSGLTFVVVTWRSGFPLLVYLNGELAASSPGDVLAIGTTSNIADLVLTSDGFAGLTDDWFVAGSAISAPAVFDLYASGSPGGRQEQVREYVEWVLGTFLLNSPTRQADENEVPTWDVECYDQGVVLSQSFTEEPYYVAAGAQYTDAIAEVFTATDGMNGYAIVPSAKLLPALRMWESGTSHMQIVNDLCGAILYDPVFFDELGRAVIRPHVAPQFRTPEWTYGPGETSVLYPAASRTLDLFDVPNRWVAYVSEPDRPVLRSVYTNTDPANPTSTVARGRTVVQIVDDLDAADQQGLDDLLFWRAQEFAQSFEEVDFTTWIMPIHQHLDLYRFSHPTGLQVEGDYEEIGWSFPLTDGGQMTHTARRVIELDDYVPPDNPDPGPDDPDEPGSGLSGSLQSLNNTCGNPILATNSTGWGLLDEVWTGTRVAITDHVYAAFAFQVNPNGQDAEVGIFLPQQNPLDAGDVWTFALDMQATVAAQGRVSVDWYTSANVYVSTEHGPYLDLNSDGTWRRVALTFTAPVGVGAGGRANVTAYATLASTTGLWRTTVADYVEGIATIPDPDPTAAPVTAEREFTRSGERFVPIADSAWLMPMKLTREQVDAYLTTRDAQGFNTVMVAAIYPGGPAVNAYGQAPYVGASIVNANVGYYTHLDYILEAADDLGMVVGVCPIWAATAGSLITTSNARQFGQFLGTRYATRRNVMWVLGGDKAAGGEELVWRELAAGLDSGGGTTVKPQTYLPADDQSSTTWLNGEAWPEFHGVQSDQVLNYAGALAARTAAYGNAGPRPWVNLHPTYEGGSRSALDARRDAYWCWLAGAAGHTYGHQSVWDFDADYSSALTAEAAVDMAFYKNVILSRPRLEPDNAQVTTGNGTGSSYTPAARSEDSTCIVAYFADGTTRSVSLASIPGANVQAWWYNPRDGSSTDLGTFASTGSQSFDPPDGNDWVLVLDDVDSARAEPGTEIDGGVTPTPGAAHGPRAISQGWVADFVDGDDFNGTALDTSRWGQYDGVGHDGNGLRRPSQISIVDDSSALGGRAMRMFGTANGTTAGMAFRTGQRFGRWSGHMRVPNGDSRYHPVLLTWPDAENWPQGGEIDYAEGNCGSDVMHFFLHFFSNNSQTHGSITIETTDWHWYEVEWTKTYVRGWCDGVQYFNDTNASHFFNGDFGSHHGTIQLDWFPGGAGTTGTGELYVDAYRMYSNADSE